MSRDGTRLLITLAAIVGILIFAIRGIKLAVAGPAIDQHHDEHDLQTRQRGTGADLLTQAPCCSDVRGAWMPNRPYTLCTNPELWTTRPSATKLCVPSTVMS
jgi:hypothetical protein